MAKPVDIPPEAEKVEVDLATLRQQVRDEGVLLPYQKRYIQLAASASLLVAEKSRRIGITWAEAGDSVVFAAKKRSARGDNVSYIGYNLEMAREFIDTCGNWARAFNHVCGDVEEFMFDQDGGGTNPDRYIKAFRIDFASGNHIIALSSKPRSLRGRRGRVILDEAAFHDDLEELIKAAMALLIWGGQVRIISTHDGESNAFNQLIAEVRSGKRKGKVYRCTFDEAVADGLYERVCLIKGEEPSPDGKAAWIADVRGSYGDMASEELDCVPSKSSGAYLPLTLLEARGEDVPILRWSQPKSFTMQPPDIREAACAHWIRTYLDPELAKLDQRREHCLGSDFARSGDMSVMWPLVIERSLLRRTPFLIELDNIPYDQQRQILFYLINHLPRFRKGVLDAGGNGEYMGEAAQQEFGEARVVALKLSENWYRENMPKVKAGLEDHQFFIPKDDDVVSDFHMFQVINGVPKMPKARTKSKSGKQRHGDAGIAGALSYWASTLDSVPIEFEDTGDERGDFDEALEVVDVGFGAVARRSELGGF